MDAQLVSVNTGGDGVYFYVIDLNTALNQYIHDICTISSRLLCSNYVVHRYWVQIVCNFFYVDLMYSIV